MAGNSSLVLNYEPWYQNVKIIKKHKDEKTESQEKWKKFKKQMKDEWTKEWK